MAGHLTQTLVAVLVLYYLGRLIVGMVGSRKKDSFIVGSSADQANEAGGTKASPMQA